MELAGNSCAATSVAFLQQLRANRRGPLIVIWDNGAAHGGEELRACLATPDLNLRLVRLPAYSPDYNAAEHLRAWVRQEATATTCFGTAAKVGAAVGRFFAGLAERADEVKRRCRAALQAEAAAALTKLTQALSHHEHANPTREAV